MQQFRLIIDQIIQNRLELAVPPRNFSTQEERRWENVSES